jgi:hypothetical protein
MKRSTVTLIALVLIYYSSELEAKKITYHPSGKVESVSYDDSYSGAFDYDDSGDITKVTTQVPLTPPISVSWNVTPAVGEAGESFAFKTRWVHDSPFIVHARFRYRVQGSVEWQTSVMGYETGTPNDGAEFSLDRSFGTAGVYELQFASDASETNSSTGLSSKWSPSNPPLFFTVLEADSDNDGVHDGTDNCPAISNPDQADFDGDKLGNACDPDSDNDGLSDEVEIALGTNPLSDDSDGDGLSDYDEVVDIDNPADTDGDGKIDAIESLTNDNDNDGVFDQLDSNDEVKNDDGNILEFWPAILAAVQNKQDILLSVTGGTLELDQENSQQTFTFSTVDSNYEKLTLTLKRLTGFSEFNLESSSDSYTCPPELQTDELQICSVQRPNQKLWQVNVLTPDSASSYELRVVAQ